MAEFFWYFLLYSFFGFALEVLFARVTRSPKLDRKCHCFLPVCPVYGLGAALILLLPPAVTERPVLLFLGAALLCSAAEYAMALFYEKIAGVSFWDYSGLPLNLKGRVCLPFSLAWGALALLFVYGVHPYAAALAAAIPAGFTLPAVLFYLADGGLSLYLLRRENSTEALRWYAHLGRKRARE